MAGLSGVVKNAIINSVCLQFNLRNAEFKIYSTTYIAFMNSFIGLVDSLHYQCLTHLLVRSCTCQ